MLVLRPFTGLPLLLMALVAWIALRKNPVGDRVRAVFAPTA